MSTALTDLDETFIVPFPAFDLSACAVLATLFYHHLNQLHFSLEDVILQHLETSKLIHPHRERLTLWSKLINARHTPIQPAVELLLKPPRSSQSHRRTLSEQHLSPRNSLLSSLRLPKFNRRLTSVFSSASSFVSRRRHTPSSASSFTLVSPPSSPTTLCAPPSRPVRVSEDRTSNRSSRRVPLQQKRELLCATIGQKPSTLPDYTMHGVRQVLVNVIPDIFSTRESMYIDIDDLPMETIDELYIWMMGHRV